MLATAIAGPASAATPAPRLTLDSMALPTNFSPTADANCANPGDGNGVRFGDSDVCNEYEVTVMNAGSAPTDGSTITLTDTLPAGITVVPPNGSEPAVVFPAPQLLGLCLAGGGCDDGSDCSLNGQTLQCQVPATLAPDTGLQLEVFAYVNPGTTGSLTNTATISGGGAPTQSSQRDKPDQRERAAIRHNELQHAGQPAWTAPRRAGRRSPLRADDQV